MDMLPVYVGLDYHEDTIRVCILEQDGQLVCNRNEPNDVRRVAAVIQVRGGQPAAVALEACCGAADFATQLSALTGWKVCLAHPGYVHGMKRSPDKTDGADAAHLADLLRTNHLPEVWLADQTTRQLRRLVRYREGLKADAGLIKAGSRELRAVLIQTAQRLPRCDAHWKAMKDRLCRTKPSNVATCAIANRWLRRLYHVMRQPAVRESTPEAAA
jgi:transposase